MRRARVRRADVRRRRLVRLRGRVDRAAVLRARMRVLRQHVDMGGSVRRERAARGVGAARGVVGEVLAAVGRPYEPAVLEERRLPRRLRRLGGVPRVRRAHGRHALDGRRDAMGRRDPQMARGRDARGRAGRRAVRSAHEQHLLAFRQGRLLPEHVRAREFAVRRDVRVLGRDRRRDRGGRPALHGARRDPRHGERERDGERHRERDGRRRRRRRRRWRRRRRRVDGVVGLLPHVERRPIGDGAVRRVLDGRGAERVRVLRVSVHDVARDDRDHVVLRGRGARGPVAAAVDGVPRLRRRGGWQRLAPRDPVRARRVDSRRPGAPRDDRRDERGRRRRRVPRPRRDAPAHRRREQPRGRRPAALPAAHRAARIVRRVRRVLPRRDRGRGPAVHRPGRRGVAHGRRRRRDGRPVRARILGRGPNGRVPR